MSLAIIPARGGSQRIKSKILKIFLANHYYAIRLAKNNLFNRVIVSTDSLKIKYISEKAGAEVLFIRPKKLSNHLTPIIDVMSHAIKTLKKILTINILVAFPVSPLLKKNMIKKARDILIQRKLNYIFQLPKKHFQIIAIVSKQKLKITSSKVNSSNFMMLANFIGAKVFSGKKKEFLVINQALFFLKNQN